MDKEEFQKWTIKIIYCIKNIADLEKQKMIWMGKLRDLYHHLQKINVLYDDNGFEDYIEYSKTKNTYNQIFINKLFEINVMVNEYLKEEKTDQKF